MGKNTMKRTIKNPHWTNNARTVMSAEFHYDDGRVLTAVINGQDVNNPDWNEITRQFSMEALEANTRAVIEKQTKEKEKEKIQKEALAEKLRHESLFAIKLKAFEVPIIKHTAQKDLKKAIRKAQNDFEVIAYAAAIILAEHQAAALNASSTSEE